MGIPWLALASQTSLVKAAIGSLVFIPGDVVKAVIAAIATVNVRRTYPLIQR
ncbi:MAG: biotin transporter BioY [Cyanobacteria bacterium J06626_14]